MEPKVSILILIVLLNLVQSVFSGCNYRTDSSYGYMCDLTLQNANGENHFNDISGGHAWFRGDGHVERTASMTGSYSTNIPAVICNKFYNNIWIVLRSMGIKSVDDYSFKNCKNLQFLDLNNNKITDVNQKSFINNLELKTLYLYYNQLSTLPENLFAKLQKLTTLKLNNNKLSVLPQNIFNTTKAIKELNLEYNQLETLPPNIFTPLTNLQTLIMSYNKISTVSPDWFKKLGNLLALSLDGNQIETLPKNTFSSLKKISKIYLNNNKLTIIHSDSFGLLPNLTHMYLQNNKIDGLYEKIIDNTKVQTLDMTRNLCANSIIDDNSITKEYLRTAMEKCFDNYEITVFGCISGNFDARMCKLEGENEKTLITYQEFDNKTQTIVSLTNQLTEEIETLKSENQELLSVVDKLGVEQKELNKSITSLSAKHQELSDNFEEQMKAAQDSARNDLNGENLSEIEELQEIINDLQLYVKNQSFDYEQLRNQVFELISRPCECR